MYNTYNIFPRLILSCLFALLGAPSLSANDELSSLNQLGSVIVKSMNTGDAVTLNSIIDIQTLVDRTAAHNTFENKYQREDFKQGLTQSLSRTAERLIGAIQRNKGQAIFLRVLNRKHGNTLLIRADLGNAGFEYLEFLLKKTSDSEYKIIDWYQLTSGQLLSHSMGAISKLLLDPDPNIIQKLLGIKTVDDDVLQKIQSIAKFKQQNKFSEAYMAYESLPENIRNSRLMITIAINLISFQNDADIYKKLLTRLARHHADDPAAAFMLIDYYFYQEKWEKVIHSINTIESTFGNDGMLEHLRANVYFANNEFEKNILHSKKAIELEPNLTDAYFSLSSGYVGSGQYDKAITVFNALIQKFGYQFTKEGFEADPIYQDFVKSPGFKEWDL